MLGLNDGETDVGQSKHGREYSYGSPQKDRNFKKQKGFGKQRMLIATVVSQSLERERERENQAFNNTQFSFIPTDFPYKAAILQASNTPRRDL